MNPAGTEPTYAQADTAAAADAHLVARMARGDERALGALYDRWENRVRTVVAAIVRDPLEAEEVVEDVFWQAWRQADRFDAARGAPGAWLVMVARSRALDRVRSLDRSREDPSTPELIDSVEAASSDPLHSLTSAELEDTMRREVAMLPAAQRDVVQLAYYEGLSQTEIAARTAEPLGTIKTRMRLALQRLRQRFAPDEERPR